MAIEPITLSAAASLSRLAAPLIKDLYDGAKKFGATGLARWSGQSINRTVGDRIKHLEEVRTLWTPDINTPLRDFFHPPKLETGDGAKLITTLSGLPSKRIIISGIVGQGKSILLRSLISEDIRNNNAKELPIFIELKNLTTKNTLTQEIIKQLEFYKISYDDDTIKYLFESGKAALLLDGFDELEEGLIKETYEEIERLSLNHISLRIVITTRPNHEILKSPLFTSLEIAKLTQAEYPAFLAKLKLDPKRSLDIRQAIKNSPSQISDLITTPLMLTLVVWVYKAESEIPETLPEFFDELFRIVFTKHDKLKPTFQRTHHSGLSERKLQKIFEAFCFATIESGYGRTLSTSQFYGAFDKGVKLCSNINCEPEKFKMDITRVACLMLEEGVDSITYLHKSIAEYYAAAFIKGLGEEGAVKYYTKVQDRTIPWLQSLAYLNSIDKLRYSKYYLLPTIEGEMQNVINPAKKISDQLLISHTSKIYGSLGLHVVENKMTPGYMRIAGYRFDRNRQCEHLGDLGWLIFGALGKTMPEDESIEDIKEKFRTDIDKEGDDSFGTLIPASAIFRHYGVEHLRAAYGIYETRLLKLQNDAKAAINSENERLALIFD